MQRKNKLPYLITGGVVVWKLGVWHLLKLGSNHPKNLGDIGAILLDEGLFTF